MRGRTGEGRGGGGGCTRRCRYRSMPNVSGFARVSSQCTQRRPISTRHDRVHHVERAGDCSCGGRGCAGGGGEGRKIGAGTKNNNKKKQNKRPATRTQARGREEADRQARPGASTHSSSAALMSPPAAGTRPQRGLLRPTDNARPGRQMQRLPGCAGKRSATTSDRADLALRTGPRGGSLVTPSERNSRGRGKEMRGRGGRRERRRGRDNGDRTRRIKRE